MCKFYTLLLNLLIIPLGCSGGGSTPPMPAPSPQQADPAVALAGDAERRRRAAAASNTQLTGPNGIMPQTGGQKSLLGT
jgi:hypothetical protein